MPGNASRQNGKKGGRPKGTLNPTTVDKIAALRLFRQRIVEHQEPLIQAHLKAAQSGNIQALNSLWDRLYGPPKESMDLDVRGSFTELVKVIHEHQVIRSSSSVENP